MISMFGVCTSTPATMLGLRIECEACLIDVLEGLLAARDQLLASDLHY